MKALIRAGYWTSGILLGIGICSQKFALSLAIILLFITRYFDGE